MLHKPWSVSIISSHFISAPIWGNLVAAAVLDDDPRDDPREDPEVTGRPGMLQDDLQFCGADFCPIFELPENVTLSNIDRPDQTQVKFCFVFSYIMLRVQCSKDISPIYILACQSTRDW